MGEAETYSTEGPKCPHCGRQFIADEAHHYDKMNYTEDECPSCGGKFKVEVYHDVSWACTAIKQSEAGQ